MKKKSLITIFTILTLLVSLVACEKDEGDIVDEEFEAEFKELDDYYAETDDDYAWNLDMYGFQLTGNGGTMTFSDSEEEPYEADAYIYWMYEGQSLEDVVTEEDATYSVMESSDQLDKEFAGWTGYKGTNIAWSAEEPEDSNATSFLSGMDGEDFKYVLLENCDVYGESVTTEELFAIVCDGSCYFAVANWR